MNILKVLIICAFTVKLALSTTPEEEKAKDLISKMTLEEKISFLAGIHSDYVGATPSIPRLNIPSIYYGDGPQGAGNNKKNVTEFPSVLTVTASWNRKLMYDYAAAIAEEQWGKGVSVHLGPMVNIARVPIGGRNFESIGEDPFLASELTREYVKGVQDKGVIACVKHWVNNEHEHERMEYNANVDERTNQEIYYPPFKAAVEEGVASVMCSYNKINGTYACENAETLNKELKGRMGFKGFVMSDWGATHDALNSFKNGLDQDMPGDDEPYLQQITDLVNKGVISEAEIEKPITKILSQFIKFNLFENPTQGNIKNNVRSDQHTKLAKLVAEESMVLLKNENNLLPLSQSLKYTITVVGDIGNDNKLVGGEGSGEVDSTYVVTPLEGIRSLATKFNKDSVVNYANSTMIDEAIEFAKSSDLVIFVTGTNTGEGWDRNNLSIFSNDLILFNKISKLNPNIIAVVHNPAAINLSWVDQVNSCICAFYPGEQAGNALASILFGEVNPSGKLPITIQQSDDINPVNTPAQYPGIEKEVSYSEKLLVGYRWNNVKNIRPLYAFGYGLSYTKFSISNPQLKKQENLVTIYFEVENVGDYYGQEVLQLYVSYPEEVEEPPYILKGFNKIGLKSKERKSFEFNINIESLTYFDVLKNDWEFFDGDYKFAVGTSSDKFQFNITSFISRNKESRKKKNEILFLEN